MIYFDNNATTRMDAEVLEAMLPFFTKTYSNPASQHHFGSEARYFVEEARRSVLDILGGRDGHLVFTSGATEGLNIALKGAAFQATGGKTRIITVQTEHKAVLDCCAYLEQVGFEIVYLSVDRFGLLSINELKSQIDENTVAVCVMLVNNETGTIQPIREISAYCSEKNVLMICDATQAIGKIHVDFRELGADVVIFSGHKFHGPKGAGAVYLKKGATLETVVHGGGHEFGLRSGSLNVPGIIGLARACELAGGQLEEHAFYLSQLRDRLENKLLEIPGTKINGHPQLRSPNVTNMSFPGVDANTLISELTQLAVANGSACTAAVYEPSHVLTAMGLSREEAYGSLRFSLSKFNTADEVDRAVAILELYMSRVTQNL